MKSHMSERASERAHAHKQTHKRDVQESDENALLTLACSDAVPPTMCGNSANNTAVVPLTSREAVPRTVSDAEPVTDAVMPLDHRDAKPARRDSTRSDAAIVRVPGPDELAARAHTDAPLGGPALAQAEPAPLLLLLLADAEDAEDADARLRAAVHAARAGRAERGGAAGSPRCVASVSAASYTLPDCSASASSF
jgi:hypothetical protein